ncbi:MAG: hypothetical protein M1833_001989 [Piccolia ochrophora]|nr:MAG: hypothetical protein M1833_001989 [Piccolia ochrophora]
MTLRPPPEGETFLTLDDLVTSINAFAGPEGYRVVKQRTKSQKGEICKAYIGCDKGRGYTPRVTDENRKRNRTSRKTDCPFLGLATLKDRGWSLVLRNREHNHGPTMPEDRPSARRKVVKVPKQPISQLGLLREEITRLREENRLLVEENSHLSEALSLRRRRERLDVSPGAMMDDDGVSDTHERLSVGDGTVQERGRGMDERHPENGTAGVGGTPALPGRDATAWQGWQVPFGNVM